jgi:tetratricopeptide (TPR) repeat protein
LDIVTKWIEDNPNHPTAYSDRHQGWIRLGKYENAISDLSKSIKIGAHRFDYFARGKVYRHIGEYRKAIDDFRRGEAMDPDQWRRDAIPLLYQADAYARVGNETKALDCCAKLHDRFWTPGPNGTPPGDKIQIAEELKRRAAAVRRQRTAPRKGPSRS